MNKSLSLEQRVGRAAGEALILESGETLDARPPDPLTPDFINDGSSVERVLALQAAGYSLDELHVYHLTPQRAPWTVSIHPSDLTRLPSAVYLYNVKFSLDGLRERLRLEQERGQVAVRLGASDISYEVTLGVYTGGWVGKKVKVEAAYFWPGGLCIPKIGSAALQYCVDSPSEAARRSTEESGFPSDPQELGVMIETWNMDPRNEGLPRLPLPAAYVALTSK